MTRLNQVIAVEKGVKSRVNKDASTLYKTVQKPALFSGFVKTFVKKDEEGEDRPPERMRVQMKVEDILSSMGGVLTELFDVTAQKDFANCTAKADVVIDGKVLLEQVPATYLLFLEKQLNDIKSVIGELPTLSTDEDWEFDSAVNLFKTKAVITRSTAKVQEAIVLYPATEFHAAQTQLITKDVTVGNWNSVKQSGATTEDRKSGISARLVELIKAVKYAREEANVEDAPRKLMGTTVFQYLFNE